MAKSHPTYDQWGKKAGTFKERMQKAKPLYAYTEERAEFEKQWYKEHGNGWWFFQGTTIRHQNVIKTFTEKDKDMFVNMWQYYVPNKREDNKNDK